MATYFHGGSEIQENMQTLYLMNPNYSYIAAYSDAHNPHSHSSMLIPHGLPQATTPHAPPHQPPPGHPFIAIPLSDNPGRPSSSTHPDHDHHHATSHGLAVSRVHHNLWSSPSPTGQVQGLSLSLSPHQQNAGGASVVTVASGARGGIFGSKYLKATLELLDEVVSVGYEKGESSSGVHKEKGKGPQSAGETVADGGHVAESGGGSKVAAEQLSPAQRQELQMKKAKLLNMLNEVEQRYRQYHTQMEAVACTFEQAAGMGSAKSYTSLALKTISRQFRCLKDGITSQIKDTSKSLGEENQDGVKIEGGGIGSRLRLVDHQLRQQKALQQLGMMAPHNAWRPQRGLPERAVSVLRAWLFEHFLHPYPKDSDKHMLAKQTGLTRSQVSNWFINARVRLWKPMVEEMYLEEVKAQEKNGDNSDNNNNNNNNNTNNASLPKNDHNKDHQQQQQRQNDRGISPTAKQTHPHPDSQMNNFISSDMDSLIGSATRSPKKHRTNSDIHSSHSSILSMDMEMKPLDHQTHHPTGFNQVYILNNDMPGRFNPDHLTGAYGNNNGVSLTLGLPHCDNLSPHPPGFLPADQGMELGSRLDGGAPGGEAGLWGISMGLSSHPVATSNGFDTVDVQSHKRFAAHQLLHDFVA